MGGAGVQRGFSVTGIRRYTDCGHRARVWGPRYLDHSFRNLPLVVNRSHNQRSPMTHPSPAQALQRAPRACFAETTPAVLRCENGRRVPGKLQVISITGGLLCLPKPMDEGSRVKLMFLTSSGSVLGAAEMLSPLSWRLQPFKFVSLYEDDQRRLQSAIQSSLDQSRRDVAQMERHRAW